MHGGDDVRRIAAVSRALDLPALVISNGAIGWHLFAAMIRSAEPEDTALSFLFDAGDTAGPAAEALRSGAAHVLSTAPARQRASLESLAAATGATLLDHLDTEPQDCRDVEAIKRALTAWPDEARATA